MSTTQAELDLMASQIHQLTNGAQQAFPCNVHAGTVLSAGMSLRDWFAGQIAGEVYTTQMDTEQSMEGIYAVYKFDPIATAKKAYAFADAMIEARKKDYIIDRGEGR
jgi:hypothetical protein